MNVQVCFPAGYEVELADGTTKRIEDFEGGEEVWARPHNKPNGSLQKCKVVRGFKNGIKETMLVRFNNGLELRGTKEHPFYVQGKGWLPLGELAVGDVCYDKEQKPVVVEELICDGQAVEVFNIEVEDAHTYYIGKNGQSVLVHNECWDYVVYGWEITAGAAKGVGQGVCNIANGIQDVGIGTVNLGLFGSYNVTSWGINQFGGNNTYINIPSPDWSRGLITKEYGEAGTWSDTHGWSKFTGADGAAALATAGTVKRLCFFQGGISFFYIF